MYVLDHQSSQPTFYELFVPTTTTTTTTTSVMLMKCAPVCGSCYNLTLESRCPLDPNEPDAWRPGDLNAMFERLISEPYRSKYDVKVWSSPNNNKTDNNDDSTDADADGPWVITMDNVVTQEEAIHLIELGTFVSLVFVGGSVYNRDCLVKQSDYLLKQSWCRCRAYYGIQTVESCGQAPRRWDVWQESQRGPNIDQCLV
jgi:hypothetical protein